MVLYDILYFKQLYIYLVVTSFCALFMKHSINLLIQFAGLTFFSKNDYTLQSVFYFIHVNWQISFVFVIAALVSTVKTAQGLFFTHFNNIFFLNFKKVSSILIKNFFITIMLLYVSVISSSYMMLVCVLAFFVAGRCIESTDISSK